MLGVMQTRPILAATLLASIAFVAVACKKPPKPGATCTKEWATECLDKNNAVMCVSSKWEAIACRSVTGCMDMGSDGNDSCSNDTQNVGEPCKEEGNYGCSTDQKAILKCDSKHWTKVDDCNGQHGCVSNAQGASCDKGTQTVGASCTADNEGNGSCTPDARALLVCKSGKMVVGATCKGMHGCRQMGSKLDCNQTIADVGDPCEGYEGKYACSTDKKTRLSCKGGKMVKDKACKSCSVLIDEVQCS
jgi:hypothetical protein